jgi:hypothetical protein
MLPAPCPLSAYLYTILCITRAGRIQGLFLVTSELTTEDTASTEGKVSREGAKAQRMGEGLTTNRTNEERGAEP